MPESQVPAPSRLITIPVSHFCEKARWALDRARVPYQEDGYLPLAHALPALRAGGRRTAPVLVSDAGVFADSTDILNYADRLAGAERSLFLRDKPELAREVEALEERFDRELGPASRRIAYFYLLPDLEQSRQVMVGSLAAVGSIRGTPWWLEPGTFRAYFGIARAIMRRGMRIDAAGAERSRVAMRRVFDAVNDRLSDDRPFLVGDRFSAADLTFAALAAPVILPAEYGVPMPGLADLPAEYRAIVEALRAEPAGAFVLRIYRDHRAPRARHAAS